MTGPDELTFDRASVRIGRSMVVIAAIGTLVALSAGGLSWGGGFLFGSFLSGLNFRWLRRLVQGLAGNTPRGGVVLAIRYLILGGAAYAILRYSPISLAAVITGLFVLTAAVFVEVVFEIVYARK